MQMNGMAELITIKYYWQQWSDPRLGWGIIKDGIKTKAQEFLPHQDD
jgi:hypothetical protein